VPFCSTENGRQKRKRSCVRILNGYLGFDTVGRFALQAE
jgi:hypothetical protein